MSSEMKDALNETFEELRAMIADSVITPIIGDIHSVYLSLSRKPIEKSKEQASKEASDLEMLQIKCRGLLNRYKWIIKKIE